MTNRSNPSDLTIRVNEVLLAIAASGWSSKRVMPTSIDDVTFGRVLQSGAHLSMLGLLARSVTNGELQLTERQHQRLAEAHEKVMCHSLRTERMLLDACEHLDRSGIPYRLMKGVALCHTVYAEPSLRHFSDADIVVPSDSIAAAVDVLRRAGGRRTVPEVYPGHDSRFVKDIAISFDGVALDLHRTLISGPYGHTIPLDTLFESEFAVQIGGRSISALGPIDLYLHAALTAGAADVPPRPITLRDLLEIEHHFPTSPDDVCRRANQWGIEAPLARAILMTTERLQPDKPSSLVGWATRHEPSFRDRALIHTYTGPARSYRRTLATFTTLPSWRDRLAFGRAIAMPSPEYRAARGWGRRQHLTRALRRLRR